jgi:hypothetical protein
VKLVRKGSTLKYIRSMSEGETGTATVSSLGAFTISSPPPSVTKPVSSSATAFTTNREASTGFEPDRCDKVTDRARWKEGKEREVGAEAVRVELLTRLKKREEGEEQEMVAMAGLLSSVTVLERR